MAAIDKIYLNYPDSIEFLDWVDKHDTEFREEFKESKINSILEFFYYNSKNVDERFKDKNDLDECHPICMLPKLVDIWVMKHTDLPIGVKKELLFNYGLISASEAEITNFLSSPLEIEDNRPIGKHVKILSRSGWFVGRNYGKITFNVDSFRYYRTIYCKKHNIDYYDFINVTNDIDDYTKSLMDDTYWYCESTKTIENTKYQKKKNINTWKTSTLSHNNTKSVKSAIRQIIKSNVFPVGTIICIEHWKYVGEIVLMVTK